MLAMKRVVFALFCIFTLIQNIGSVFAKEIQSYGQLACGAFLAACDASKLDIDCQVQAAFAEGYISGVSWEYDIPVEDFDDDTVKYALIKYCSDNPLADTHEGAAWILRQLM